MLSFSQTGFHPLQFNRSFSTLSNHRQLKSHYDLQQVTLLEEPCIVVDVNDKVLGMKSKKDCHLFTNNSQGILHRAFSVFLFNTQGDLLLQRRSPAKITFPGYYTNSCCSHPLYIPAELTENDTVGVKIAAQRRLEFELGIQKKQIPIEKFDYLTRIHYCAAAENPWGEHEIDYILFIKADVDLNLNLNEVSEHRYVSLQEFPQFYKSLATDGISVTPWFQLITSNFLLHWWKNLSNIDAIKDLNTIHRL